MLTNKLFGVISLGCDKNRVDTEKLLGLLKSKDCRTTDELSKAQIVIINTCAFLQSAREEAIETILECADYKSGCLEKIVVTGCLPQKFIDELYGALSEADVFLGILDYEKIFEALEKSYAEDSRQNYVKKGNDGYLSERVLTTDEHYAYLKIADGCYNHCTYCLIPKIRGKYRSYPMEKLVAEAKDLGDTAELILVAQDSTRYGEDLYGENKFVKLLQELSKLDNIQRIRLLYCYPDVITDELIDEIAANDKILKYMDIPLQHSENRVLKLMNRKGAREGYLALFEKLRAKIPNIAIRSTFISGFPTETELEFEGMQDFIRQARLINCGFFAYSREPDTGAYRLKPQIHHATKKRRVRALYELQAEISADILNDFVGKKVEVLCDGIDYERNCFVGRAYFSAPDIDGKVYFNAAEAMQGERYEIIVDSADSYDLYGHTEDYEI
ncbi:MAG: 30S ribosomal protein S12 methylthiotransferase RimO [Clostridiales bacterium]|nr:30S ribosomal protein S12 methylthiotransferase RimO [Clostridiales bacterium]MBE7101230.1 30S ribosomal protein S12 methylthiotransferase RimO [Clostridiales bacterium]